MVLGNAGAPPGHMQVATARTRRKPRCGAGLRGGADARPTRTPRRGLLHETVSHDHTDIGVKPVCVQRLLSSSTLAARRWRHGR
ncbi:hypothetical protein KCP69_03160 [Salmonella enterica subsp. enterica]|nr:hypothetical protein KCP69_03160 [Salmonella enterica subsp. enterica]